MKREIKFKFWCLGTSENLNFNKKGWWYYPNFLLNKYYSNLDIFNSPDFVACQYIGLKDQNGAEIYEGDIVRYEFDGDTYPKEAVNKVLVCKWDQRQAWFIFDETLEEEWNGYLWREIAKYSKVIGNIYENPELLNHRL